MDTETMASPDMLDLNASSPPHASQAPPVPEQQFDTPNGANNDFRASANGTEYKEYNSASKQSHHAWRKRKLDQAVQNTEVGTPVRKRQKKVSQQQQQAEYCIFQNNTSPKYRWVEPTQQQLDPEKLGQFEIFEQERSAAQQDMSLLVQHDTTNNSDYANKLLPLAIQMTQFLLAHDAQGALDSPCATQFTRLPVFAKDRLPAALLNMTASAFMDDLLQLYRENREQVVALANHRVDAIKQAKCDMLDGTVRFDTDMRLVVERQTIDALQQQYETNDTASDTVPKQQQQQATALELEAKKLEDYTNSMKRKNPANL